MWWAENFEAQGGFGGEKPGLRGAGALACTTQPSAKRSMSTLGQSGDKRQHSAFLCQEVAAHPRSLESFGAF